jgi:hypothetical protein
MEWLLGVTLAVAIGSGIVAAVPAADEAKTEPAADVRFEGKLLYISAKSSPESGHFLEKPEVRKISGGSFLVGKAVDIPDNLYRGQKIWIACDDVAYVTEFKDVAEYEKLRDEQAVAARK